MSGTADDLVRRMRAAGVRAIFGLPGGGGNLDVIAAAGRAGLPFVLTATETGSAIAAIAQSEITGAPGACVTTIGPGAASVVNGVACAWLERAPLLVVTDRYPASAAAFAHQRIDHRALMASIAKWSGTLTPGTATDTMARAFDELGSLPPGPVHLDYVSDPDHSVGTEVAEVTEVAERRGGGDGDVSGAVLRAIAKARKPLLIVGLGARTAGIAAAIRELCESRGIPALVTYKAKGVVPDAHPWFAGLFTHAAIERPLIEQSDLLIGIGFDPVEILPRPWTYTQPIVSVASWRMADNHVPFAAQHVGDVAALIRGIGDALPRSEWDQAAVRAHVDASTRAIDVPAAGMTAQTVVESAAARLAGRARVTVDAGAHMLPATMMWPVAEPNELLISNGLSTMGFAVPAAIGAGVLDRRHPVVALTGDGGLLICLGELQTAVRERLRIITIVFNDASLSLIEIKQQARRLDPAGVALGDIEWPRIAEGFGMPAWTASTARELDVALEKAIAIDGPSLIEARIDRSNYAATLKAIRG